MLPQNLVSVSDPGEFFVRYHIRLMTGFEKRVAVLFRLGRDMLNVKKPHRAV